MSRIYYFIEAGRTVDLTARFYRVEVSATKQGDRDFLFLLARAASLNYYFELRSVASTAFIARLADSLGVDFLPMQAVKARDLVRAIKKGVALPPAPRAAAQTAHFRELTNLDYRAAAALLNRR